MRHRADANQAEIVKSLRTIPGVTVWVVNGTFDLIVGYKGVNHIFDVKNPKGRGKIKTAKQKWLSSTWRGGEIHFVTSLDEILQVLGIVR